MGLGQNPDVVEILQPRVRETQHDHRLKLLGNDRFRWIGPQARCRLIEQHRQLDFIQTWLCRVAMPMSMTTLTRAPSTVAV
jgi:hypothetical protein